MHPHGTLGGFGGGGGGGRGLLLLQYVIMTSSKQHKQTHQPVATKLSLRITVIELLAELNVCGTCRPCKVLRWWELWVVSSELL